ncbi:MAG: competence/damage-inducible protein A [bacterium]
MNVEVINVGTELLLGEIVNTNAPRLFKLCKDLGFDIYYQTVVGDNKERLSDCLEAAFARGADLVITTGGLGPTQDDITKEVSADYLGLELVYHEDEGQKVQDKCLFLATDHHMSTNNYKQAYFPKDAVILDNPVGTASGCVMTSSRGTIINLPGPPKEFNYMLDHSLKDYLRQFSRERLYTLDIMTRGIGESRVDEKLSDLIASQSTVSMALYAHEGQVRIRLGVKAHEKSAADDLMAPIARQIRERMADYLVQEGDLLDALRAMHPRIAYTGSLEMPAFLEEFLSDQPELLIQTEIIRESLGDRILIHLNDQEVIISTLGDYHYSQSRIASRFAMFIYRYLKGETR